MRAAIGFGLLVGCALLATHAWVSSAESVLDLVKANGYPKLIETAKAGALRCTRVIEHLSNVKT